MAKNKKVPAGSTVTWKDPEDHGGNTYEQPIGADMTTKEVGRRLAFINAVGFSRIAPGSVTITRPGE